MRLSCVRLQEKGSPLWFPVRGADLSDYSKDNLLKAFASPITLLAVNHETRFVALKEYRRPFRRIKGLKRVYFNFDRDILFLQDWGTLQFFSDSLWLTSPARNGRGEIRNFMYGGQWQDAFVKMGILGELETLVVDDKEVGRIWDKAELSNLFLSTTQRFQRTFVSFSRRW